VKERPRSVATEEGTRGQENILSPVKEEGETPTNKKQKSPENTETKMASWEGGGGRGKQTKKRIKPTTDDKLLFWGNRNQR